MHCTDPETITAAKTKHRCSWCWQVIDPGASYIRWRFYDGGDAGTCKAHPECFDAMNEVASDLQDGFTPGDNPRGCNCGFDKACERCHPIDPPCQRVSDYGTNTRTF